MSQTVGPDELLDKLRRRFGSGTDAAKRESLYTKLCQIVELHGDAAYRCVASAAADAANKSKPDHYFCKVVILRLREHGFIEAEGF